MALFDLKLIHNGGFSYLAMPKQRFFEVFYILERQNVNCRRPAGKSVSTASAFAPRPFARLRAPAA